MQIARSLFLVAALVGASRTADAALTQVTNFGSNPGALSMYEYVPAGLPAGRPIVVVLHGCTMTAADMQSAGWNTLADQYKFTVVYPQQETANNPVRCFNWAGEYGDTANLVRGQGENQSIIQMVDKAIATHGGDTSKVYVVGFSAGAAFTAVLAATWPERFAGVSINAGMPYRCATSVNEAFSCQNPGVTKTATQWGDLVRGSHAGPYPRVQIWAGSSDTTVAPMNLTELAKQWTDAQGTDATADSTETIGNATHATYTKGGAVVVETYSVSGMSHAVAIGNDPAGACPSTSGTYFSDKGICSTLRAAMFFGLTGSTGPGTDPGAPDTQAPTLAIETPTDGDTVTGQVTIVVAASDDVGVDHVELAVDGASVGSVAAAPYQFAWDATAAGGGAHELVATAVDAAGNSATSTVSVTVPGAGSGSGSGSGNADTPDANGDLPGCSLDAGGGGSGVAMLGIGLVAVLRRRRRS